MKKLLGTLKQIAVLILAIAFIGCEDDDVVLPKVVAGFTYTVNIDTGTVTFINISENANTYTWDFGDNSTSTLNNPIKTYENGTYTVVLNANNVAGASDVFQDDITILIPEIATIPISFDGANTNYDAELFGGASFAIVDNPDPSGANPNASKVGEITNSGAQWEGLYFDLGAPLSLETQKTIKMLFWSNTPIDVLVKLEEGTGADVEATASHGGTGWEEMYFTFDSAASYSRFTMFVDGAGTTDGKFYFDDISQIDTADIPCQQTMLELPIDFDCNGIAYTDKIVGNVSFDVVDNPELSGINSEASKVGKITNVGANWENAFFNLDTPIDFTTDKGVKLKLFSDQALPLKLKFEDGTEDPVEADVNHTGSGWEELTFTLTSTASYNDMILFVDGPGTAVGTFYIDDIEQVAGTPPPPACTETMLVLPTDFDCNGIDYVSKDSGDVAFEVIDNPELSGINATPSKVAKLVFDSNQPWENMNLTYDTPISFATDKVIKFKMFSSSARAVKLKFEGGGPATETDVNHTGSGWEELEFTMNSSDSFTNLIVFVDGGSNTVGTFYIDDIEQVSSGGGGTCTETMLSLPIDFDCEGIDYVSKDTGDVAFEVVDNPELSGINATPSMVGKMVFDSNQPWENMNLNLDTPISFATDKSIKLKLFSNTARVIKLKVETGGTPDENDQNHTGSGWEELTFTLTTSESFSNLIVFVDGGSNTAGTFYIDDIEQVSSGGGGGSCPAPPAGEFIADGDFEANAGCWELIDNGGTVTISTTINNGGSNSGQIKTAPTRNPALKQTRFGVGVIQPNTTYEVKFDIQANASDMPADGAVFQAFTFSEPAEGSTDPAAQHILVAGDASFPTTWETRTYTFTTAGNVDGGLSLLLELVCGGAGTCTGTVNIDNVSVKVAP
ncbi:PKD domain-containing protein [Flavivirga spongiicola]|uniref:PKD domain-containing protein n=1 Tax=Flavivirga spongiicola TaxID=421621 RepID=A0ABU7XTQ7_9FLAO|nr:PKD domain-containing protein [Flavivirga sp. MEBiC05379]MDO5978887.1 PKD domain-containing protein [Flavivirga sp. MEBiC05379]